VSEIEHYMQLVAQLRRQAEIDTAALNEYKALADDAARIITVHVEHAFVDGREVTDERAWLARYYEARGR
jgi:hypothetical protein